MLAMSDRNGDVFASMPGLAKRAGITLPECETAITAFLSPDQYSRTKDYEGRRIAEIDGGWTLLNHAKYRALLSAEERKEYNRRKQAERRDKLKNQALSKNVNDSQLQSAKYTHTEAEAEAEADKRQYIALDIQKPKSDLLRRAEKLFNRRESTQLDKSESKAYKDALPMMKDTTEEEWQMLEKFYVAKDTYKRTSFATLLNNWNGEVQKAKDHHENGGKPRPIGNFGVKNPTTYADRHSNDTEQYDIPDL